MTWLLAVVKEFRKGCAEVGDLYPTIAIAIHPSMGTHECVDMPLEG